MRLKRLALLFVALFLLTLPNLGLAQGLAPKVDSILYNGWTTGGRPSSPATGQCGFNTTNVTTECWNGSAWVAPANAATTLSRTDVSSTYVTSGGISLTDSLSVINASGTTAMTLAAGLTTVLQIDIHNVGAGTSSVTGTIEGATNTITLIGEPNASSVTLRWLPSLSTWIIL